MESATRESSGRPWLDEPVIEDRSFRMVDVPARYDIVEGKKFLRCTIYGPAMLALLNDVAMIGCTFNGDIEAILLEVPEGRGVIGPVGVRNGEFRDCTFFGVGIVGPKGLLEEIRNNLTDASAVRRGEIRDNVATPERADSK